MSDNETFTDFPSDKFETNDTSGDGLFEFPPYPDFSQINYVRFLFIILYFIVMILSVFGNAAVCYTVLSNRKMKTVVNFYIVNLAVCDFLVGSFVLPVKLLELTAPAEWRALNDTLCSAMFYLQTVFVFASVLTLVATCLERFLAVVHPFESRMQQSKSRTVKILIAVWTLPCLAATPFLYPSEAIANTLSSKYGVITRLTCFPTFSERFRRAYFTLLFVFFYLLPLTFIGWSCFRIAKCLLTDTAMNREGALRRQEMNRRKVAKMVLVVVFAFTASWTPYFLVTIITQYQEVNFFSKGNYFFTMLCINFFAFLNSSVNPFIYVIMSTRFRNGFSRIFRCILCATPVPDDKLMPARVPKSFACLTKYHRQMILFACGEPTQISTDSVPSDSGHNSGMGSFKAMMLHQLRKKQPSTPRNCNNNVHKQQQRSVIRVNPTSLSTLPVSMSLNRISSSNNNGNTFTVTTQFAPSTCLERKTKSETSLPDFKRHCDDKASSQISDKELRKFTVSTGKRKAVTICKSAVEVYATQING